MAARKRTTTPKVDETVENQENPGTSTEERGSTETPEATTPEMAPAQEVDDTVKNQESLGSAEVVDRNPDPQIVTDSTGSQFDVSKSAPELVDPDAEETAARRARLRQTEGAMNAKDFADENKDEDEDSEKKNYIVLVFVDTGLTVQGRVWRAGHECKIEDSEEARKAEEDSEGNVWYDLSAQEQKDRYGKVFFEKR
jgi:hypothetical protein